MSYEKQIALDLAPLGLQVVYGAGLPVWYEDEVRARPYYCALAFDVVRDYYAADEVVQEVSTVN